jgi:hypothetical protein
VVAIPACCVCHQAHQVLLEAACALELAAALAAVLAAACASLLVVLCACLVAKDHLLAAT